MTKILTIVDKENSAIDRLAQMIKKNNEHLDIEILPFHPKRYSKEDLKIFEEKAKGVDLIDAQYWKSMMVLVDRFPWLEDKKKILTHHNPYDLDKVDSRLFNKVIVKNKTQQKELTGSVYIPHAVDMDLLEWNEDYDTEKKVVGMVAARIEGKKGIKEVAQACRDLGYRFLLIGRISKMGYFKEIMGINPETDFRESISDEELKNAYKEMSILICNSVDGFESGTMPILEAMTVGVPVLTRSIGLVPDIYDGENLLVRMGKSDDVEDLKNELRILMEDKERRLKLRNKGWQTVKNFSDKRMANSYAKIYNQVIFASSPLVSVITPTYNRKERIVEIVELLEEQTYKNIEFVVCDDNSDDGTEEAVKSMREGVRYPIKYINTESQGYNLAMARNMGVIEADGQIVVFLDSRFVPDEDAIERFVDSIIKDNEKKWIFGCKGYNKTSFVENFSAIRRELLIKAGMFNERITEYGGMSQELRNRFISQGFKLIYAPEIKAKEICSAPKKNRGRRESIQRMKDLLWRMNL